MAAIRLNAKTRRPKRTGCFSPLIEALLPAAAFEFSSSACHRVNSFLYRQNSIGLKDNFKREMHILISVRRHIECHRLSNCSTLRHRNDCTHI